MGYIRGTQNFASSTFNSEEWPGIVLAESKLDPVAVTGGTFVYTVDDNPAVALDPPTAEAWVAYLRALETTPGDGTGLLFYRTDGTAPTTSSAFGFLRHGDFLAVKLTDFTDFQMIAGSGDVFSVFVEWLAPTSP
jgi:hypothetical protein